MFGAALGHRQQISHLVLALGVHHGGGRRCSASASGTSSGCSRSPRSATRGCSSPGSRCSTPARPGGHGAVRGLAIAFVKAALFLCVGIVLHRLRSVNETWLHGRGRRLPVTGVIFTAAALALADLPPFGTFLGKGWIEDSAAAPWLTAVFIACGVLVGGAVLRFAGGVFYGLGDPPGEDPQMAAEANEELPGETDEARQRTPLSMLVPAAALTALGLAAGIAAMAPKVATGLEAAAARFQDQPGYIATVLSGARVTRAMPLYPVSPADVTVASVVTALCSVLGAAALALAALYWRRLPLLRRGYEPSAGLTVPIRRFQSGVINDYITWLIAGVATLGGLLAIVIRGGSLRRTSRACRVTTTRRGPMTPRSARCSTRRRWRPATWPAPLRQVCQRRSPRPSRSSRHRATPLSRRTPGRSWCPEPCWGRPSRPTRWTGRPSRQSAVTLPAGVLFRRKA